MAGRGHRDIFRDEIDWKAASPGTRFAIFPIDEANPTAPAVVLTDFGPGEVVAPHAHDSNYFEYVLAGEQTVGKTRFGAGDIRMVKRGTGYGPIRVGPEGCSVLIIFEDGSRTAPESRPRQRRRATVE